ncbi:MAG: MBL fold metallo-hydrolase [Dehalococcoidia bacterium]|nr:MBL fold metallo-hydrolase [Dehalococcoidia bacterium]
MIDEVLPGVFRMAVPLPKSPLRATNSYLFVDRERSLVVDTAFNRPECREAFLALLKEAGESADNVDYFITHLHADHMGLAASLARNGTVVYFNEPDLPLARPDDAYWEWMGSIYKKHGLPLSDSREAISRHPGRIYGPESDFPYTIVHHGDIIHKGGYTLRCVQTVGHTPGHMCLLVEESNTLVCGDHILGDITPNITMWTSMANPLGSYLESLDMVARMGVRRALTGHRSIVEDCAKRIEELKEHHRLRLQEVVAALQDGEQDAATVTPRISWDLRYERWDEVHPVQKMFATGEAIAHLQYLEAAGVAVSTERDGRILYGLAARA